MRRWTGCAAVTVLVALAACGGGGGGDDDEAAPVEEEPAAYVALGDSFSAGVGAPPYDPASGKCQRSELAWPHVLDEDDAVELVQVRACGGAKADQLLEPWTDRNEPAQIADAPDPDIGLVTLTIGGNDAGFGDVVTRCVLGDCSDIPGSPDFTATLETVTRRLVDDVYPALRTAYPEARILHVGYPRLTPATGPLPAECGWLSPAEQTAAVAIVDQLNGALEAAAEASEADDVTFVDIGDVLAGHEVCTPDSWINPISLADERAHPTAAGYRAIAEAVLEDE